MTHGVITTVLVNKTNLYKYGAGISVVVISATKLIYAALTNESDLEKYLHGLTQNLNESFNATIWERASKSIYCGREVLELAVYDAVANYNYGRRATSDIFELLNMKPGHFTTKMRSALNTVENIM